MVKTMLLILTVVFSLLVALFIGLILWSQRTPATLGLTTTETLQACPNKPNCICSEDSASFDPIKFKGNYKDFWEQFKNSINNSGGKIKKQTDTYLWATFSTPLLHFVDDVEARLDIENQVIHLRSASRVGHSDLGRNKARANTIKALFEQTSTQTSQIDR